MTIERATRNVGWVFGLYLVRSLVRLGYLTSFARLLEEGFGSYYFLLAPLAILSTAAPLGLNVFLMRQINRGVDDARRFVSRCLGLNLVSSLLFSAGLLLVAPFTGYAPDVRLGMMIMGLTVVPLALIAMMQSVGAAYEKLWIYAVLHNATPLAEAAVGIVLLLNGFGLVSLCVLHLVLYSLYALVFFVMTRAAIVKFSFRFHWRAWTGFLTESWKIWVFAVQSVLYARLGVVILSALADNLRVGVFAAAMMLIDVIGVAANAFRSAVFPYMVRAWHRDPEELRQFQQSCVRLLAAVAVPMGLLGIVLAGPVMRLLFRQKYLASIPVLQVLVWLVFPIFFERVLVRVCHASGHTHLPIVGHTVVNVIRIVLSVVLVMHCGEDAPVGLAWALVTSSMVGFVIYTLLIRRYIYAFAPLEPLARTAAASAVPVALVVLLMGRLSPILLALMVLVAFVAGVFLFRIFTTREFEIIKRALLSFTGRKPDITAAETETNDEAQP